MNVNNYDYSYNWIITPSNDKYQISHKDLSNLEVKFLNYLDNSFQYQQDLDDFSLNKVNSNYTGAKWVAVGKNGKIATSPDGITWTLRAMMYGHQFDMEDPFSGGDIQDIEWNGSIWVAVGAAGTVATSPNGTLWNTVSDSKFGSSSIYSVATNGTMLVVAEVVERYQFNE